MKLSRPQRIKRNRAPTDAYEEEHRASPDHRSWEEALSAATSISSRTGGFEVPQYTYPSNNLSDDDTIQDASVYTGGVVPDTRYLEDDDSLMDTTVYTSGELSHKNITTSPRARSPPRSPVRARSPPRSPIRARNTIRSPVRGRSPTRSPRRATSPTRSPLRATSPPRSPVRAKSPTRSPIRARSSPVRAWSPPRSPIYVDDIKAQITSFKDAVRKHWSTKQSRDDEDHARSAKAVSPKLKTPTETSRRKKSPQLTTTTRGSQLSPVAGAGGVRNQRHWPSPPKSPPFGSEAKATVGQEYSFPGTVGSSTFNHSLRSSAHHFPSIQEDQELVEEPEAVVAPATVSYRADRRGGGYEVIDQRHYRHRPTKHCYADCDDPSIDINLSDEDGGDENTTASDFLNMINVTDNSLMERSTSPGAVRLTEKGLQHHEQKALLSSLCVRPENNYEAWKKEKERKKWRQGKHQEMQDRMLDQSIRQREAERREQEENAGVRFSPTGGKVAKAKRQLVLALKKSGLKKEDVSDVSLAPLNTMESIAPAASMLDQQQQGGGRNNKGRLFSRMRRPRAPSIAAKELLEKERAAARESRHVQKMKERQEKERIEKKRLAYLEAQRAREAHNKRQSYLPALPPKTPASVIDFSRAPRKHPTSVIGFSRTHSDTTSRTRTTSSSQDLSTISSLTNNLPPCKVCGLGDRTHIATPCMHFAFCASCASKLQQQGPSARCPICCTKNVSFASVSV